MAPFKTALIAPLISFNPWPVMNAASSLARKLAAPTRSAGVSSRWIAREARDAAPDVRAKVVARLGALDPALEPTIPACLALLDVHVDDPRWQADMPKQIAADIRRSLQNVTALDYFTLTFRRLPTLGPKFRQLRETGVTLLVGTDSGVPGNFHTDSTWRELDTWVRLGATPMQAIAGATRWPARFLKQEQALGTLAPGRYADVIAVRGDVLSDAALLQRVDVVVKNGVRVR